MASVRSASLNRSLGAELPAWSRGRDLVGVRGQAESFLSIFIQKVAKS